MRAQLAQHFFLYSHTRFTRRFYQDSSLVYLHCFRVSASHSHRLSVAISNLRGFHRIPIQMSKATLDFSERCESVELADTSGVEQNLFYERPSDEQCPLHDSDLPIHKAAYKGDISSLRTLIPTCEDIDARSFNDCTSLHLAIRGNHTEAVRLLLLSGADPTLEDTIDSALQPPFNAVDLAAWVGAQHAMAALIDAGLNISASALEKSSSLNFVDCMQTILDKLPENKFSDCSRLDGVRSALVQAACCWHLEAVDFLLTRVNGFPDRNSLEDRAALGHALASAVDLEYICIDECRWRTTANPRRTSTIMDKLVAAGADVNAEHRGIGKSAFWIAAGDHDITRFLLRNGLRQDIQTEAGYTPLFGIVSVQNDDCGLLESFIASGADVNHTDRALRTPMHYAANRAFADILHQHGADPFAKDKYGMTPLHMACTIGRLDVIQFLLSKGAMVDEAAVAGWTPLLYSTFDNEDDPEDFPFPPNLYSGTSRLEVANILLGQGANIRAATNGGQTVLHGAARLHDTELVRYLVDRGANVRAVNANFETALHNAARTTNVEIVRYLIDQGADVHAVTTRGETILHAACSRAEITTLPSISSILKVLLDHGVDVNARDVTGLTSLHLLYDQCYRYHLCGTEAFNLMARRGADRLIANNAGEKVMELVEKDNKWAWDEDGLLKAKRRSYDYTHRRGGRGRGGWERRLGERRGS
jgi:ankyrin repeat protein